MKISQGFKAALVLGVAVGFGIGYLAFDQAMRAQLNRKYRKGVKLVKRQTHEVESQPRTY